MMNNPLVSVILPVYNGGDFLKAAIQSILTQTFTNFELIIINDGSTDGSIDIINSFDDDRILLITRENKGLIYTLNEGISIARGKYLARMDADDISLSQRFLTQVTFLEKNPNISIVGSFAQIIQEEKLTNKIFKQPITNDKIKAKLFIDSPFIHPSLMIRTDVLKKNSGYPDGFHRVEDFALWVILSKKYEFYNIPEVLLYYRVLKNSETRLNQKDKLTRHESLKKVFKLLFDINDINYSEKELENYTYSMFRPNFNLIDIKSLDIIYTKINELIYNRELIKLFSFRWLGIIILRRKIKDSIFFINKRSFVLLRTIF